MDGSLSTKGQECLALHEGHLSEGHQSVAVINKEITHQRHGDGWDQMDACKLPLWHLSFLRKLMEDVSGQAHCIPAPRVSCPKPVNVLHPEVRGLGKGPQSLWPRPGDSHSLLCKYQRHSWEMKDGFTGSILSPSKLQACIGHPGWLSL